MGDSSSGKVGAKHHQDTLRGRQQKSAGRGRLVGQVIVDGGRSLSSGSSNGSGSDTERLLPRSRRGKATRQQGGHKGGRGGRGAALGGGSDSEPDDEDAQSMSGSAASRGDSASSASGVESENRSEAESELSKLTSESDSEDSAVVAAPAPVPTGRGGRGRRGRGRGRGAAGVERADVKAVGKRASRGRNAAKPVFTMIEVPSREQVVSAALLSSRWVGWDARVPLVWHRCNSVTPMSATVGFYMSRFILAASIHVVQPCTAWQQVCILK
jgi:hypothetical protein